jgi:hypothetical protein
MSSMKRLIAVPPFMAKCGVSKIAGEKWTPNFGQ